MTLSDDPTAGIIFGRFPYDISPAKILTVAVSNLTVHDSRTAAAEARGWKDLCPVAGR
jgi:hypothetical protein